MTSRSGRAFGFEGCISEICRLWARLADFQLDLLEIGFLVGLLSRGGTHRGILKLAQ